MARNDGLLTAPSHTSAKNVALGYVRGHRQAFGLDASDIGALRLVQEARSPLGISHVSWVQTAAGISAYDNVLFANFARDGRLINLGGSAVPDLAIASTVPKLSAGQALAAATSSVAGPLGAPRASGGGGAERATRFSNGDTARLTLFSDGKRTRLAWRVQAAGPDPYLYEVVVDAATGAVLLRRSLTDFASNASVFDNYPGASAGGAARTVDLAAPDGGSWLNRSAGSTVLQGNNAHAYADVNANNFADPAEEAPASSGGDWLYPQTAFSVSGQACPIVGAQAQCSWNSSSFATRSTNQRQATTQLFYLVNTFHDHLKGAPIGFDQAHRNFEFANDGSGQGVAGDPVNAESNDGSGSDNANFSTPGDGFSPRMQMYFFTNPSLNSDDEADIVYHEYTHGLSNRSVGTGLGISAIQSAAMGEGWSDWYAMDFLVAQALSPDTSAPGEVNVGGYVLPGGLFGVPGIRHEALDCATGTSAPACPGSAGAGPGGFTLGDMGRVGGGFEVHNEGEIWAQTLWDLRQTLGSSLTEGLVTDGMRVGPDNPSFLEARDAIIQADQATGGTHYTQIWQVFARRGMGFSASTASANATTATEAFDLPPLLAHQATAISDAPPNGDGDGAAEPGEAVTLNETLANPNPFSVSSISATLTSSSSGVTVGQPASSYPSCPAMPARRTQRPSPSRSRPAIRVAPA
ncbi:MAG: M36 family metallopeptidase [Actinomycetota bacterium]|nr:M36 family metallopeptidase [Actinomycetota bacterium]